MKTITIEITTVDGRYWTEVIQAPNDIQALQMLAQRLKEGGEDQEIESLLFRWRS